MVAEALAERVAVVRACWESGVSARGTLASLLPRPRGKRTSVERDDVCDIGAWGVTIAMRAVGDARAR